jgi:hypothetical protein
MRWPRTSSALGWTCTILSVAVVAAWVLGRHSGVVWFLDFASPRPPLEWLPGWRVGSGWVEIGIPYWMLLVPMLFFAASFWRAEIRRRRVKRGVCPDCLYSRRGLAADATCPECGTVPAPAPK